MEGGSGGIALVTNQRTQSQGIRIENPFTLKVGQVFTGFGLGCGIGIGVGRPINLDTDLNNEPGAIPVLNQVMSATRGATDAFSGVSQHVNSALKKVGANNIEAGVGCGVGIGHGFGVGLALKPWVLQQIQFCFVQTMTKTMEKVGIVPNLPIGQSPFPSSLQGGMSMINSSSSQNPIGSITQLQTRLLDQGSLNLPGYENKSTGLSSESFVSKSTLTNAPFGSRTEQVISNFLQSPTLKGEEIEQNVAGSLKSENGMLHMVLKHQQVIEELKKENEKLRQILVEELKVAPEKLEASNSTKIESPCTDCFDCRRKQRKCR